MENIRDYLNKERLITDGAMGTYYTTISGESQEICENANITNPDLIERIHREYIEAGARLVRTNTFAANTQILGIDWDYTKDVIQAACRIAKHAAEGRAYIAGDIGMISENLEYGEIQVLEEYKKICDLFLEQKTDVILFETFSDTYYIKELTDYIRRKSDVFIIINFCINKNGYSANGFSGQRLLELAAAIPGIDALGFNCGIGSGHMRTLMEKMKFPHDRFICCLPNAGYPEQMQNRMIFMDNAGYFSNNMKNIADTGIDILGGCCGTTPGYIRELVSKVNLSPVMRMICSIEEKEEEVVESYKNEFFRTFESGRKVIAVELDPPYDAKYESIIEHAGALKKCGVDIITMADSPMGRSRVDSILMSVKVARETGMKVMPHICCRDKNMIAIRSALLGAYVNDIRNLLLVTGDPVPSTSRNTASGVFDYNSIRLMNYVKEMNKEHFREEPFYYGGALNVGLGKIDRIIDRMKKKIDAGAAYFLTQPIYTSEAVERMRLIKESVDTKILCGIMPFVSYRNADFMKNEFLGIDVPDETVNRYSPEMSKEDAEEVGVSIACELMDSLDEIVDGYYFMLPFNRVSILEKIFKRRAQ